MSDVEYGPLHIAIIGAGISGLTAGYRLQSHHRITLFEAEDRLGGHALTIDVGSTNERHAVDVGFMVFNDRTYPNFVKLLSELDVLSQPTSMSFSVSDPRTGLEYNGHSLDTLFAQRQNLLKPRFLWMLAEILRFNKAARHARFKHDTLETVGEYLERGRFSTGFARHYLLPMGAAIWSCPAGTFARFPMRFVAEFFENHGLLDLMNRPQWRVIQGGSRTYVNAIAKRLRGDIRTKTPIESVCRDETGVWIKPRGSAKQRFDHVVFACHSDQALRILGSEATASEREILSAFPYQQNTAVLHTDESLLPRSRRAWACWNVRLAAEETAPAITTYHLNQLQGIRSATNYCVTLNADEQIDSDRVLHTMRFDHPVFTARRDTAQARHRELLTANRTSFCGAYWRNGFHEDGVVSALTVVDAINSLASSSPMRSPSHTKRCSTERPSAEVAS